MMKKKSQKKVSPEATDLQLVAQLLGMIQECKSDKDLAPKSRKKFLTLGLKIQDRWQGRTQQHVGCKHELREAISACFALEYEKAEFHCKHIITFL